MKQDSIDRHVAGWADELDYLDPLHEEIVARLMVVTRHLTTSRDSAFRATGDLPRPAFKVMLALRRRGVPYTASPSELADDLGLTRGALSSRLGPLEDQGFLTRTVDKDDRRRVLVRLTAKGRRAYDRHARSEGRVEADLLGALSATDQRRLADLLRPLVQRIES